MRTSWGDLVRARLGMTPGDLFTPGQAAEVICLSAAKVRRDIETGLMPATDVNGGRGRANFRITRGDIEEYVGRVERDA